MLQNEVFQCYMKDSKEISDSFRLIQEYYDPEGMDRLYALRGYTGDNMRKCLEEMGGGFSSMPVLDGLCSPLLTKSGSYLLENRFIIPVEDIAGRLNTLIGYYPDDRKYITVPMRFFSKECMFFNFRQAYELSWREYGGLVIVVEGIFDCLALRSIGLPCIATMGSSVSQLKCELLKLFSKVLAIPDDDAVGRASLNRYGAKGWKVPEKTTFILFKGGVVNINGEELHCKDMDNFVNWYEAEDVRECLLQFADSTEEIETLDLE